MSTRAFGSPSSDEVGSFARYQLDVIALDTIDLVCSAGGWLFDRSMAGWDVNVTVSAGCNPLPLRILGINPRSRRSDRSVTAPTAPNMALAASADAINSDLRLRADALHAIKHGIGDVLVWGTSWPPGVDRGVDVVEHQLSAAARAFKRRATSALGLSVDVNPVEVFRGRVGLLAGHSDLTPSVATSLAQR